ncbi:MAG: hypothetical protein HC879_02085 [Leptolyngbyaceae cyanobacterium SL_5_9]|nr:hypothetical protein [Leptolyngbyaceae cyanobacterium SL_5_9]
MLEAFSPYVDVRTIPNTHINAPKLLEQAEIDLAIGSAQAWLRTQLAEICSCI